MNQSRRKFIQNSFIAGAGLSLVDPMAAQAMLRKSKMKLGLVTYQWGKDWDLPTLIANCEKTGFMGVELRTEHAHGVETVLSQKERLEVKKRFADSPVTCVGYGANFDYHHVDQDLVKKNIQDTIEYLKLCADIGATGVKVKPNGIPTEVPREKTISQIAAALNECGKAAKDLGQVIRVEVHGNVSQEIPNMKAIFDQVTEKSVKMCWNCNEQDLLPPGLEANFNSVKKYFGHTVHIRELNVGDYPYQQLMDLFVGMKYDGWILLEARTSPTDRISAMKEQLDIFNKMIS
ncbi:sugar phosphate isomerase/epimerase family protein [Draconibacterium mangrovi]|uniref:sugar phosphate isomerase/epimerase family protein n=1 Tax=Draconibacterium mangrovi TaxID=2697469 RepID=UPI0013D573D9|nr:TIM barrel protein [Draconibacterium mangrovi]